MRIKEVFTIKRFLAIDFGTTQTSVAILNEGSNREPEIIEIHDGQRVVKAIATAIQLDENGNILYFGAGALAKSENAPERTFQNFKVFIGSKDKKFQLQTAVDVVRYLLNSIPDDSSPKHIRDRAIISLGFAGAFRRSELCALNVENLKWTFKNAQEILLIEIQRSKTDQEGQGMTKAIFPSNDRTVSPLELLKKWLIISNFRQRALFTRILKGGQITSERLTPQSVRLIVKKSAMSAGLSLDLSAHSLRSGFVTTAIRQGKSERSIMNQTGHKSTQVLREYFIREDAIEDNAAVNII